jgi:hypothetical protein
MGQGPDTGGEVMAKRKQKLAFQPGMTIPGKKYRVVTFTLAFRVEEPASIDMEQWRAQLFDAIDFVQRRDMIPDEEFIIGYDPKQV